MINTTLRIFRRGSRFSRISALSLLLFAASVHAGNLVKETFMVPMRDGVSLATDVYKPADGLAHPAILYRTPYDKESDHLDDLSITVLMLKGYAYVIQDCRGRFASEGADSVFLTDGWGKLRDGYDTIDWLVKQSWCDGNVGMMGGSATGITTYLAAGALHPNLKCCVALVAPSDFYHQVVYPGGEVRKSLTEEWLKGQGSDYMIDYYMRYPYYGEFWHLMNLHTRTHLITTPILHIGGWYDCFSEGTVAAFNDLKNQLAAGPQKLVMGPWIHGEFGADPLIGEISYPDAGYDLFPYVLLWLDHWLLGVDNGVMEKPNVIYYLLGDPEMTESSSCQWLEADDWPPAEANDLWLYLHQSGSLDETRTQTGGELCFTFDPDNPVPTLGGNNLEIKSGPYNQKEANQRDDVLEFTTEALTEPIRVEGVVRARIYGASNCPDTDFTFKLCDVYPDGREMLVTDGIQRLRFRNGCSESDAALVTPGEVVELEIALPPTAIVFNTGHRIKACISSSNYPRYEVNPNSGAAPNDRSNPRTARNTVYCGDEYSSAILLPVVDACVFVAQHQDMPVAAHLANNYPNPFNERTTIRFSLAASMDVSLSIFNLRGQRINVLVNRRMPRGNHTLQWDGRDGSGRPQPSGVYFCILQAEGQRKTVRMLLLR